MMYSSVLPELCSLTLNILQVENLSGTQLEKERRNSCPKILENAAYYIPSKKVPIQNNVIKALRSPITKELA